jgi:L-lactate dehydrogenase (cytochrome)
MPRVLVNVERRDLGKSFLGKQWELPFGIAPMGLCNLAWPDADRMLAGAALKHGIPLCLSTMASTTIEDMRKSCGENAWFQLYVGGSEEFAWELVSRAEASEYEVMLFTVDVPQVASRIRDLRNGFLESRRFGPRQALDFAVHPHWVLSTLAKGKPDTVNVIDSDGNEKFSRMAGRGWIDWEFLDRLRDRWKGTLLLKGVLSPEDAVHAVKAGVDGLYVSNHGGRQLESAPPSISMLPLIRNAVGTNFPLLFDSGVRSGESVVKALALGADFVMLGRPFLYAIGAAGKAGLEQVVDYLRSDLSHTLAETGCTDVNHIDHS